MSREEAAKDCNYEVRGQSTLASGRVNESFVNGTVGTVDQR